MSKTPFIVNLDRICKTKGISITKMLKELGWSTSKVTLWNNGSLPKMDTIEKIAEFLGVPVSEFFIDPDAPFPGDPNEVLAAEKASKTYAMNEHPEFFLSEDEQDIITIFRACTRREQHEIMAMIYKYEKEEN